jgi:TolB protein
VVQVYVMNADGSGLTQLTRGPGFHGTVGYAPDGTKLAIESDWGSKDLQGIYIIPAVDPDGVTVEEATRVTDPPKGVEFDNEPQYSPDGSTIVFSRFKSPAKSAIMKVNADGTELTRLTSFRVNASDPDWSPDGQTITFDSGDSGEPGARGNIYVMNPDGSDRERLTKNKRLVEDGPFRLSQNPVFSPDGTKIAYTQYYADGQTRLMVMNTNGSGKEVMLKASRFPNKVDWGTHP